MQDTIKIILTGGPANMPEQWSVAESELDTPVKIPHRAGYEHYDPTGTCISIDGISRPVFRWSYRTRIAE